jgi:undecaprenyl-diphosphatase
MIERILRWDVAAVIWVSGRRRSLLDSLMKLLTRLGNGHVWLILGTALSAARGVSLLRQFVAAYLMELSVYLLAKRSVSRPRPFVTLPGVTMRVKPPDEFSFPSGHTAAAFVMVVVAGSSMGMLAAPLLLLAMGIGLSRVYLGVHYPSDVLAGAVLGSIAGVAAVAIAA